MIGCLGDGLRGCLEVVLGGGLDVGLEVVWRLVGRWFGGLGRPLGRSLGKSLGTPLGRPLGTVGGPPGRAKCWFFTLYRGLGGVTQEDAKGRERRLPWP